MQSFKVILIPVFFSLFLSCGGEKKESSNSPSDSTITQNYFCPMDPEIKGKEGDTCSKCGMKLEKEQTDSLNHKK